MSLKNENFSPSVIPYNYYHLIFGYIMFGRRFKQILRCLCVSELNASRKEKIVRFIDAITTITKKFRDCYKPIKELSLDDF